MYEDTQSEMSFPSHSSWSLIKRKDIFKIPQRCSLWENRKHLSSFTSFLSISPLPLWTRWKIPQSIMGLSVTVLSCLNKALMNIDRTDTYRKSEGQKAGRLTERWSSSVIFHYVQPKFDSELRIIIVFITEMWVYPLGLKRKQILYLYLTGR